jgi:diguanylate cyclase (GGDEF)-like protein
MFKNKFLRNILLASLAIIIVLPVYDVLIAYPSFINALTEDAKDDSVRIATHLISLLDLENEKFDKESLLVKQDTIQSIKKELNLYKIKAFSPAGENLFSTDPDDLNHVSDSKEFFDTIANGNVYIAFKRKGMKSLENKIIYADVVETYVPVMDGEKFLGAFEIYYDITNRKARHNILRNKAVIVLLVTAFGLFVLVLTSSFRAKKYMSERDSVENELRQLSLTDELTGLYNRRGFSTLAEQQLKNARREKKKLLLLAADLDNLKKVNDNFGHPEGDEALRNAAAVLKNSCRESDIVARIGGDEFAVLAMESPDMNSDILATRIKASFDEFNSEAYRPYDLSMSTGIVRYDPEHHKNIEELFYTADKLMYDQKKSNSGDTIIN